MTGSIRSHRDLIVWQKAMDLAVLIYAIGGKFPREENHRLTSQLLRAAASVSANIAEGHGRATKKDYAQFVSIARGSLMEAESLLSLALRLGFLQNGDSETAFHLITEISKMLTVLRQRLLEPSSPELPNKTPRET